MNLFGFQIKISRRSNPEPGAPFSPAAATWLRGDDATPAGATLSSAYEQVVWVYRAINVLAEQVANIPFLFSSGERGRENLITSGPLVDFYNHPHPQISRFQYWELRIIWLMLRGECFRVPIYESGQSPFENRKSKIKNILILDPALFHHVIENHQLIGWRYTGFGPRAPLEAQVFLPEEVWFEKLPNPFDFWRGSSPLSTASLPAKTDFAAAAFMQGLMENNADLGVIVHTEQPLNETQQDQLLAALRNRKRKAGTADRPLLLWNGAQITKPELSSADLQFLENRKFSRAEICAAFGVPEEIVTTSDHSKYDVMAGARLNFIENRIAPLCSRLEAEEDITVKQIEPRASGWFDLDSLPILQEARRSRLAAARTGFEMGVPFNELNRVLDLGFKPLPWGDHGYLSSKLQKLAAESPGPDSKSMPSTPLHRDAMTDSSQGSQHRGGTQSVSTEPLHPEGAPSLPAEDPLVRAADLLSNLQHQTTTNAHLLRKVCRFFFEQRCRALARIPALLQDPSTSLLELQTETSLFTSQLKPFLEAELNSTFPDVSPADVASHVASRQPVFEEINCQTLQALQATLEHGLTNHESADQLSARVKAVFNEATSRRAEEIAHLETEAIELLHFLNRRLAHVPS